MRLSRKKFDARLPRSNFRGVCCISQGSMRITVNDTTTLYFDVEGGELVLDGDELAARPTLIALHGGPGFDHGYLRPGLAPLHADAQVVFVDLRGQGRSAPVPAHECTLEQMADDVAALCRTLGIERPIVFGHSAGGFVALHLALRHRSLLAGLILCHTAPTPASLSDRTRRPAPPSAPARRRPRWPSACSAATSPPKHVRRSDASCSRTTQHPRIITGRHDWVCPPAGGRAIANAVRGAELVELPDAGHFGFSESPRPFRAAVRAHLARIAAAQPTSAIKQRRAA
jgi:proline iminopeptidase